MGALTHPQEKMDANAQSRAECGRKRALLEWGGKKDEKTRTNVSKSRVIKVLSSPEEEEEQQQQQEEEEEQQEQEEEEQRRALLEPAFATRRG